jgi:hypothetical protein
MLARSPTGEANLGERNIFPIMEAHCPGPPGAFKRP